jgi:hypothetical protein
MSSDISVSTAYATFRLLCEEVERLIKFSKKTNKISACIIPKINKFMSDLLFTVREVLVFMGEIVFNFLGLSVVGLKG